MEFVIERKFRKTKNTPLLMKEGPGVVGKRRSLIELSNELSKTIMKEIIPSHRDPLRGNHSVGIVSLLGIKE
ncbi:MAG: hypothetical protein EA390_01650 [Balneolaceae bacterium]|nr:MAG: hypothetical protein EA390_01650 [Balneolaceae bacterium]